MYNRFQESILLHLLLLVLLPALVYCKTIGFGFVDFDDVLIIKNNYHLLSDITNIKLAFFSDAFLQNPGKLFYRPVQTISYMFDAMIGKDSPWIYHLSNLLIHILTVISFYFLLNILRIKRFLALLIVLLFSIHPLFASDISWMPARGDLLIGLLGIWLFISFIKHISTGGIKYFILHAVLFLIIIFTKETCILFPAVLLIYYWFIFKQRSIKLLIPYGLVWTTFAGFYLFMRNKVIQESVSNQLFGIGPFIKNLPSIPIIFGKFFIPHSLTTLPLFDSVSLIIGILFFILTIYVTIRSIKENNGLIATGFLWFLILSIAPMFVRVMDADYFFNYFEHRSYLPLIGLMIALAAFLNNYIDTIKSSIVLSVSLAIILLFSIQSYSHSQDYKDNFSFYGAAIKSNPEKNALAYTNRGNAFMDIQDYNDALTDQQSAVNILETAGIYYSKGYLELQVGDMTNAEKDFSKSIELDSAFSISYINRSVIYDRQQKYPQALADIEKAEKLTPDSALVYCKKGNIFLHQNIFPEAIKNYTRAISLNPSLVEPYNKRAMAYFNTMQYENAIKDCKTILSLKIEDNVAYNNMGLIYLQMKDYTQSINAFTQAIAANSNDKEAYFSKAIAELKAGKLSNACADWNTSLHLGLTPAQDSITKYCK